MTEAIDRLEVLASRISQPDALSPDEILEISDQWEVSVSETVAWINAGVWSEGEGAQARKRIEKVVALLPGIQEKLGRLKSEAARRIVSEGRRVKDLRFQKGPPPPSRILNRKV